MRSISIKLFLCAAIALLVTSVSLAQHQPNAEMVDEFGAVSCEDLVSRIHGLADQLRRVPGTRASFYMFRPKVRPRGIELRRKLISSTLQLQGIDRDMYMFHDSSTSADGEIKTQVWKVPAGALEPGHPSTGWNEPLHDVSRRFLFGQEDDVGICPTFVPKAFAKLLNDNPGSHGRIIVREGRSGSHRFSFAKAVIAELVDNQGLPRKRLRLSFAKSRSSVAKAEYWFVPGRRFGRR